MMERLTEPDRPLYGRADEMVVAPLGPAEVAAALGTDRSPVDLLDVYLATGGYPRLVLAAGRHRSAHDFVHAQLADDQSPLAITGLRMLDAEFREDLHARRVLDAIGAVEVGHATFTSAVAQLGNDGAASTAVSRALEPLTSVKRSSPSTCRSVRQRSPSCVATAWRTPTCGSGSGSLPHTWTTSLEAGQTSPSDGSTGTSRHGGPRRSSPWCIRRYHAWRSSTSG